MLITGATGFIGRNLVQSLPSEWDAVAVVRRPVEFDTSSLRIVEWAQQDDDLPPELADGFDVIVHLAGNANHGLAESEPWTDLSDTGLSAARVLGRVPARRVTLLSSAAVYAGLVGKVSPKTPVKPPMAYALSKLYVEGLLDALVQGGRIESRTVLRLYNAFGPGERSTRLIPRIAAAAAEGRTFTLTGDPASLSDPVHVDHVIAALVAAAGSETSGVFDLCGGDPVPLQRQVSRIATALGFDPPRTGAVPRVGEVPIRFFSDPVPLLTALRISPPEPLAASVRRYGEASGLAHGSRAPS